ncbi:DNA primase, partial [Streptococcus uberis]|nr:DNA primase [Streptococcus uberis]
NANLWGFGKKIVEALNKVTNGNYEVKSGHVRLEDYDILDPMGFKKDILKSKPKGIRKMKLGD